jgi:hypothetical protein
MFVKQSHKDLVFEQPAPKIMIMISFERSRLSDQHLLCIQEVLVTNLNPDTD